MFTFCEVSKKRKQTLQNAQYGLQISFNTGHNTQKKTRQILARVLAVLRRTTEIVADQISESVIDADYNQNSSFSHLLYDS